MDVILLVEDNPYDSEQTALALRGRWVQIEVASTGEDALAYLDKAEAAPLFLLVDLGLPLMSGVMLIHKVRENPKTARIPIIILTGRADDAETYKALGADAYLLKPLEMSELLEALKPFGLALGIIKKD